VEKKVLFVLPEPAKAESATPVKKQPNVVYLSGRNIPNLSILPASELNTLAILDAQVIVFTESAVGTINERWAN
jgi:ribosomal protein L4